MQCTRDISILPLTIDEDSNMKKFLMIAVLACGAMLASTANAWGWMPWDWFDDDDDYWGGPWGGPGWGGYPGYGYGYPGYGYGYPGYGYGAPGYGYGAPGYGYGAPGYGYGAPGYGYGAYPYAAPPAAAPAAPQTTTK